MTISINLKKISFIFLINLVIFLCCLITLDVFFGLIYNPAKTAPQKNESYPKVDKNLSKQLLSPYFGWNETPDTKLKGTLSQDGSISNLKKIKILTGYILPIITSALLRYLPL